MNETPAFELFVAEEWMIPAAAAFMQMPVEEIRKTWDASVKNDMCCVIRTKGDIPANKNCPVCRMLARQEQKVCATPSCEYPWKEA